LIYYTLLAMIIVSSTACKCLSLIINFQKLLCPMLYLAMITIMLILLIIDRLEYIMLFKLPIILSGNSYLLFPNISFSNSWNCKNNIRDSSVAGKITSFKHKIYTQRSIYSNRAITSVLSDCLIRANDCSIRIFRPFFPILC